MFNNLQPGKKLLILSACPVLVLLWISIDGISRRSEGVRDAAMLEHAVEFSRNLGDLIYALQLEMIYSAATVLNDQPHLRAGYQARIVETDKSLSTMIQTMKRSDGMFRGGKPGTGFSALKTRARSLEEIRATVLGSDALSMEIYDLLIDDLIAVNDALFSHLDHVPLSERLHSEIHLMLAGQSVARQAAMLARPSSLFSEAELAALAGEEARYSAYYESFLAHLGRVTDDDVIYKMTDTVAPEVMIPVRGGMGLDTPSVSSWEATVLPRMEAFHSMAEVLFEDLELQTAAYVNKVGKSLFLFAFTTIAAIVISLLIAVFFARTLVNAQNTADRLQQRRSELDSKNQELEKAKAELEEKAMALETAARFKSEFLANMSHELRTPLNSLLILTDVLAENREANLTEKQLSFLRTLRGSGAELRNLINEVLDLAKVESGKMDVLVEEVDLDELMDYVRHNFGHMVEARGLKLVLSRDPELPASIWTDSRRLKQILKNLLSNAVKFTERGAIGFEVGAAFGGGISLAVSDTGIGIPSEKQALIFQAFQQAEGGISRKYGGTGLGLSISKNLANLLGGRIELKSRAGQGSTFTIYLPLALPTNQAGSAPVARAGGPIAKLGEEKKKDERVLDDRGTFSMEDKVLLIIGGDAEFAREIVDEGHERNFKVLFASRHPIGRQMARDYDPNAIFLNSGDEVEKAAELLKQLKRGAETRHIPVQVVTDEIDTNHYLRLGAVGIVPGSGGSEVWETAFSKIEEVLARPPKRVLLVSGDRVLRKFLADFCERAEMDVTVVGNGGEVFNYIKIRRFDCFAVDYELEDCNAVDLIEQLTGDQSSNPLPGLIFSRKPLSEDKHRAICQHTGGMVICGLETQDRVLEEILGFIEDETRTTDAKPPKSTQPKADRLPRGKNILLVDGDVRNAFALTHLLEERGLNVLHAFEGGEALEMLDDAQQADLIIMDHTLPDIEGEVMIRSIREVSKLVPLVVISASSADEVRNHCLTNGANAFLAKPILSKDLLLLLSDLLTAEGKPA